MKKIIIIFLLGILLPYPCYAEGATEDMTQELLERYTEFYGNVFEEGIEDLGLSDAFLELVPEFRMKEMFRRLSQGRLELSLESILHILLRFLLDEVWRSMKLLAMVLAASVLCSYLTGLKDGFGERGVTQAAYYACYLIIAGIAATAFYHTAEFVGQGVSNMARLMEMVVPVVITTLVTSGALVSASIFEPILLSIVGISVKVIQTGLIPIVMITTAMNVAGGISERFKIQRLIKFMNQCVKWGLSVMLTVFVSAIGLQSIAGSGLDGISVKLTKFAAANLIPVVGGILAETVETVMNCSLVIKNSVGILGIICLLIIGAVPLLKVGAILIVFRLTAAVAEPVTEPKIISCLSELANSVSVLFSMLAAVTIMFVIVLTIVISAGNTAMMLGR